MGSTHADDHHPARPRDAAGSACPEEIRLLTRILTGVEAGAPLEDLLGEAAADIGRVLAAARVSIVRLHPGRPPELLVPTGRAEPASANAVALATATGGSGADADAEPRWGLARTGCSARPSARIRRRGARSSSSPARGPGRRSPGRRSSSSA